MSKKAPSLAAVNRLSRSSYDREQFRCDLEELRERECEALRLYEPLPHQQDFHSCTAQQCLVQKGNRTGSTLSLCVEIARAVTGTDPFKKYPKTDGKAVALVYGENHVGRVIYNGLFRPGHFRGFRLIRDLETNKWRSYRPWPAADGGDLEREAETMPHGPLIPKRYLQGKIAWTKHSERVFSLIRFTTGWELYAANSAGDPGQFQGMSINLYAIDEDLATPGWYEEAMGRVTDCNGLLRWTALPHAKNNDMMSLVTAAERESELVSAAQDKGEVHNPAAVVLRASIFENKFLNPEYRDKVIRTWQSMGEDVYRKRAYGEMSIGSTLMYPAFGRRSHDVMKSPTLDEDTLTLRRKQGVIPPDWDAARILAACGGVPPEDWTRYVSIDPGYNICAIAFLAVPPKELGNQVFLYDLSYIHEATSVSFGEVMREKCDGSVFESFIFDMHGGRLRGLGHGDVPWEEYRDALVRHNVASEATGHGFTPGNPDRKYREEVMRTYLAMQRDGQPKLMYVGGKCQSFVEEIEKFKKKTVKQHGKDIPIDEGDRRAGTHAIEAVEQAIANGLSYVKPRRKYRSADWMEAFNEWGKKQQERIDKGQSLFAGSNSISLGPNGVRS